jgi:ABC-2 type transport system permease protein
VKSILRELVAEYRRIFLDPGAVLILVAALALYAFFYPIPYHAQVLKRVPVVVVDEDQSDLSRRLVRMIDAHELTHVVEQAASLAEAEAVVRDGRAGGVVVVPGEFQRRILRGEQVAVAAYTDASYFLIYRQALTGILEATGTLSAGIEVRRLVAQGMPAVRAMKARDPLPLVMRPLFNAAEGYDSYVVPAVLVLILQQTLLVGIGTVRGTARERRKAGRRDACPTETGALRHACPTGTGALRHACPTGTGALGEAGAMHLAGTEAGATGMEAAITRLIGKTAAYYSLYLVHALIYFGIVYRLFGFPQRADALTIFRFVTPFLLSVIFLGLAVRSLFRSRETAIQVLLFTSLPALFVSGFAWPVEAMPRWLATFAKALPSTSAIPGALRLTQMGATLQDVRAEWLMLWALCGVYFAAAWVAEFLDGTNVSRQ